MNYVSAKKRVVIVQEHLPHYRQGFYEHLRHLALQSGLELHLLYSPSTAANLLPGELDWATPSPIRRVARFSWQNIWPVTREADLVVVQQETKYAANLLLQCASAFNRQKVAYWGHGRNFQSESSSLIGEQIKRTASRYCDWWFAYNELSAEIVREIGFPGDRITSVQNSIDTRAISEARSSVTEADLDVLRDRIGIHSRNIGVYTGGLYREKRLPFLFESCRLVRLEIPDFELIVIGRGPESASVQAMAQENPWVHFVGPKSDVEKVPYWMLSRLLLMPGLVGLVVLDSFALGVPMVTTNYPYHSPEISYLENGKNGVVVSPWPDAGAYAGAVVALLKEPERIERLSRGALESSLKFSVETMASNFAAGITAALEVPKLSRVKMFFRKPNPPRKSDAFRLGVVVRSLAPYLRDFYDALAPEELGGTAKIFIGQRGSDWVNPWDEMLMTLRRTDHAYVKGKPVFRRIRTVLPSSELIGALERFHPSVLLVNEYSPLSMAAAGWALLKGIPWFVATDIGPDYRAPYPKLAWTQKVVHRIASRFCDGILALTPSARKRAEKLGKPFLLCPHAVDTRIFIPRNTPRNDRVVSIIALGNFIHRKGYDLLLAALHGLETPAGVDWRLACYGAGSPDSLLAGARALGLENRVSFSAFLDLPSLVAAYQEADLFVHPSRSDTYGVVVHEAASCGLPLVVSRHAGASEVLVKEGVNGFVVDPEDASQFRERLRALVSDDVMRRKFSIESRKIAVEWDVRDNARRAIRWMTSQTATQS